MIFTSDHKDVYVLQGEAISKVTNSRMSASLLILQTCPQ